MTDVLDEVVVRAVTKLDGADGAMRVTQSYLPPLDGRDDSLYEGFDMQVAEGIGVILNKEYFGYEWKTYADTKQGIVGFSIPELMGPTLHMVINLKQFSDLGAELIVRKGGELLERMNLPRDKFSMAEVAFARANRHKFDFSGPNKVM